MVGEQEEKTGEFAAALRALREAAGSPTLAVLVRQASAQRPPLKVSTSSLSDWLTGKYVPSDQPVALFLIRFLRGRARQHTPDFPVPTDAWWEQTRVAALGQRREGESRGGRPASSSATPPRPGTPVQARVGLVPRRADCFQDREAETRLDGAVAEGGTVVLCHVLAGTGGVGKTQLAARYANRVWDAAEVEVLVWVTATSASQIVDAYARAAVRVIPGVNPTDPQTAAVRFMEWAAETSDRWLVVLDDVRQPGDLAGWWPPDRPNGRVVVTTRDRTAAWNDQGRALVDVGLFTSIEARAYLKAKLTGHSCEQTDANLDALAADLGHLPLALAQAAVFLRNQDLSIPAYRALLSDQLLRNATPRIGNLPDEQQQIVAALWDLSVDQAEREHPAGLARPLLYLTSVLDPNGIPSAVLTSLPAREYLATYLPDLPSQETMAGIQVVDETLRVLHRFSLLDHDRHATYQEVRVHQLVQRATRENETLSGDPDLFTALAETAADALVAVWPNNEGDQLGQILRANTAALHLSTGRALWQWNGEAHPVLFHALTTLGQSGQVSAAATEYAQLLAMAVQHFGPDHPDTLTAAGNLAFWRARTGDFAGAIDILEPLLDDCLRVLGPDHSLTLKTRGNLADCKAEAGDLVQALPMLDAVLADCVRLWGPSDRRTLEALSSLARYQGEAGDVAGALASSERLLSMRSTVLGPYDPQTLVARNHVANWRGESGDAQGAAAAFEELVADCSRVLGSDHPDTLTARNQLARWRGAAGNPAEAAVALESLLTDEQRVLGPDHPGVLATRGELARWRGEAGDAAGTVVALENLLIDRLRVFGPDHPHIRKTQEALEYLEGVCWTRVNDQPCEDAEQAGARPLQPVVS